MSMLKRLLSNLFNKDSEKRLQEINLDEEKTTNRNLCAECKGLCCQGGGCLYSPRDFKKISYTRLLKEIEKGFISIELIDGDLVELNQDVLILRARNRQMPIVDNLDKISPCVHWSVKHGCDLSYTDRPTGGKLLIPKKEFVVRHEMYEYVCVASYTLRTCCEEWKKYQRILKQLVRHFRYQ